jgi:predicted transcriptional regulator of viral defense system
MIGKRMENKVLKLTGRIGVLRPRDLTAQGIPREYAQHLWKTGRLQRVGRGLYTLPESPVSTHRSLAEVSKAVPRGVICLLSALRFHGLTTQLPSEVWIAVESGSWRPSATPFPVRIAHFSEATYRAGVESHRIDGVRVPIYSAAKTVADCFKYRNKIGVEVAVEALRDYLAKDRSGGAELWRYAQLCRVANVMRPYLEAAA